jgi:low temperature requirement protein LtrA
LLLATIKLFNINQKLKETNNIFIKNLKSLIYRKKEKKEDQKREILKQKMLIFIGFCAFLVFSPGLTDAIENRKLIVALSLKCDLLKPKNKKEIHLQFNHLNKSLCGWL